MRLFILSFLSTLIFAGDPPTDKPVPQPPEVLNALAAYEKQVTVLNEAYRKAENKVRDDAFLTLQKVQEAYLKKGDLEGAVLVKESIKKLASGETLLAVEENIRKVQDLLGFDLEKAILGKWIPSTAKDYVVQINARNTASIYNKSRNLTGKWKTENNKLLVAWENGIVDIIEYSISSDTLKCDKGWTGNRVK